MRLAMDKGSIRNALAGMLQGEILRATEAANRTRQGAIHEEARPENDKDTRALEASYLARGQAQRVVDLERDQKRVAFMELRSFGPDDAIELSALVLVQADDGEQRWYFFAPAGGGRRIEQPGVQVDVITPEAPLGQALAGRQRGDDLQVRMGARVRELSIAQVL